MEALFIQTPERWCELLFSCMLIINVNLSCFTHDDITFFFLNKHKIYGNTFGWVCSIYVCNIAKSLHDTSQIKSNVWLLIYVLNIFIRNVIGFCQPRRVVFLSTNKNGFKFKQNNPYKIRLKPFTFRCGNI